MVYEKQLKSDFQYLTFLDERGYLPLTSNSEDLLCESIMNIALYFSIRDRH
jgi:hypothetical protein